MVKLPDVPSLGESPVPQSRAPILSPSNPGVAERAAQQVSPEMDKLVANTTNVLDKQATLQESSDRLRALRDFREKANTETNRVLTQEDISSPQVTKAYGAYMNQLEQETLKSHGGRPESAAKLSELLFSTKTNLVENVASKGAEALYKKSLSELSDEANMGAQRIHDNPDNWRNEWASFSTISDDQPLSPEARRTQKGSTLGYYAETAATSYLLQGRTDDAINILGDPQVAAAVPEARRTRLLHAVELAQRPVSAKDRYMNVPGVGLVDVGGGAPRVAIGERKDERTTLQKNAEAAGLKPGTSDYADFIRAGELKPGVSIDMKGEGRFVEKLGELSAEKIGKLNDNAQAATANLTEIDRMKAAMDSGRFQTGALGDFRANAARFAEFLGAPDEVKKAIGDAATADTLEAATKRLALNEIPKLERTLVAGLKIVQESLPSLSRTPEGNKILLEVMERMSNREIQMAELANNIAETQKDPRKVGNEMLKSMRELEKRDPIITDELRQRITDGTKSAPKSLRDIIGDAISPPAGVTVPDGYTFVRMQNGKAVIKGKDGKEHVQQ